MEVTGLYVYPIKACAGHSLERARLAPRGLDQDRWMMVVDADGRFLTQRECPRLALVQPALQPGSLTLTTPGVEALSILVISEESLAELNTRLEIPMPMNRFRPNIVVHGATPYAEDTWKRFTIGGVAFEGVKTCARCAVTTTDQATAERGREPLATLAKYRDSERGVLFGMNVIQTPP